MPLKQVIEIKSSFEQVLSMFSFHVLHPPSYEIQSLVATHSMRCKRQGTRTLFQVSHEKRWLAHWKSLPGGYFIATTLYMYTTKDITITKISPFFLAITISSENCQPLRVLTLGYTQYYNGLAQKQYFLGTYWNQKGQWQKRAVLPVFSIAFGKFFD